MQKELLQTVDSYLQQTVTHYRAHSGGAISAVVSLAKKSCCNVLALDVKHAINSAIGYQIEAALADIDDLRYLARFVQNYPLRDNFLVRIGWGSETV